jgi:hypothetical protein
MSDVKPREFWIDNRDETLDNFFLYNVKRGVMNYNFEGAIHTIEYSALEAERERSKMLVEALEFYANDGYGFKVTCEEEIGDGPRSGWIQCDDGTNAREALAKYRSKE